MINRESTVRAFKKALDWCKKKINVDSSLIKKSKLVELDHIDVTEDPVRRELDLEWRKSFGRKIFGLQYNNEVRAVMCLAFTNDVPHTVRELDLMSKVSKYENSANTVIASGEAWGATLSSAASSSGSAFSVAQGIYFAKGQFVNVSDQSIILSQYSDSPSYRVGLFLMNR